MEIGSYGIIDKTMFISMKRPRLAFICDRDLKEELEAWAKEENRTLSNLIESICKKAIADKNQTK